MFDRNVFCAQAVSSNVESYDTEWQDADDLNADNTASKEDVAGSINLKCEEVDKETEENEMVSYVEQSNLLSS